MGRRSQIPLCVSTSVDNTPAAATSQLSLNDRPRLGTPRDGEAPQTPHHPVDPCRQPATAAAHKRPRGALVNVMAVERKRSRHVAGPFARENGSRASTPRGGYELTGNSLIFESRPPDPDQHRVRCRHLAVLGRGTAGRYS